ncbi:Fip1 motif-domain-containing protein [Hypoxylon sp. NC1633]|nr:Fip1 motif-domain-containing protein [Hypoxylon sp. NC1633]
MDIDDDDDFYAPDEPIAHDAHATAASAANPVTTNATPTSMQQREEEDLEEGEEEDEGTDMEEDDSDIDIITERKDGTNAPPPTQSRYSDIRNIPQRSASSDAPSKTVPIKTDDAASSRVALDPDAPAVSTSKVDVNAIPVYKPVGKPITQVNIDEDLAENDKPWRKPGTDLSDYFNYGFDEFTWTLYAAKQDNVRNEYSSDAIAQNNKKMLEDMQMMMMSGMPGMGGGGAGGTMASIPGMDGMTPEMQAMMQQMMAAGLDPSQMDPSAMFAGMQNTASSAAGGQAGQNQSFGGPGQGFGGTQGQNFSYEQGGMGRGGGGSGFGGRGRGGRRNW